MNYLCGPPSLLITLSWVVLASLGSFVQPAWAQVFELGPSDPGLFDVVFDLPPHPNIRSVDVRSLGGDGLMTQVNIDDGGAMDAIEILSGVEVNVRGGFMGPVAAFAGSEVNVIDGEVSFLLKAFGDAVINISGGTVGSDLITGDSSVVNISGGKVGSHANVAGTVNISGGTVGFNFVNVGEANISGGNVDRRFQAASGSIVNISGGVIGDTFIARQSSEINISGGRYGEGFFSSAGSRVNILGTRFLLDGVLLESLPQNDALTITDRDVTLSGNLADGTPFSFDLNTTSRLAEDFFSDDATLTVTLVVPEPVSVTLATLGVLVFLGLGSARVNR